MPDCPTCPKEDEDDGFTFSTGTDPQCQAGQNPEESSDDGDGGGDIGGGEGGGGSTDPRSGEPQVSPPGFPARKGYNMPVNPAVRYSPSGTGGALPVNGSKWMSGAVACLSGTGSGSGPATGQVRYVKSPTNKRAFLPPSSSGGSGGTTAFNSTYFIKDQLTFDGAAGNYLLMKPNGSVRTFDAAGKVQSFSDAAGNLGNYHYSGDQVTSISVASGSESNDYAYTYGSGGKASDIVYSVNGRAVLKTSYGYDGDDLRTVKIYENSAAAGSSPVWGTPISSTLYTYYTGGNGLLRHVIPPAVWRQMVNNGINPETATETQLNTYAATEYQYGVDGRVSVMFGKGRRYQRQFSYGVNLFAGSTFNDWVTKTAVVQPDGSLKTYYYNRSGQLMLMKVSDSATSPTKVWYPVCQQFEDGTGRLLVSADSPAVGVVSESNPNLFTLNSGQGQLTVRTYTSDGDLETVSLKNGTAGAAVLQQTLTYVTRTVAGQGSIRKIASNISYSGTGGTGAITTSYAYTWHSGTFQIDKLTTTLPVVGTGENGTGATYTTESHYDTRGFLIKSVDERGTATTYTYDQARGGVVQVVQDQGTGRLNLTTDYQLDDRGRTIRELGPIHSVVISTVSTSIRTARWTYYKDEEDGNWTFQGYRKTSDNSDYVVGPVTILRPNLAPPSGFSGYRQASRIDAVYGGSNIPSPTDTISIFPQSSTWVRWSLDLIDTSGERTKQWNYFVIPSSGYGTVNTNYGEKQYFYDSDGRQNMTTCAGGTTDKTTYNAMGWAVQEELGVLPNLDVTRKNQYDDNGNPTKVTLLVDSSTANDRVTDNAYDWRNRQTQSQTVVEKDGGGTWTLLSVTAYDNRSFPVEVTGYHTSVASGNRTSYQTSAYDARGRLYRTLVYGVSSAGATSNPQTSNTYYDPTGAVARSAPSGSKLFTATQYDAVGRALKTFQAYPNSGDDPTVDPASVAHAVVMEQQEMAWDAAGNVLSTIARARFDDATGDGELQTPTTSPKARVSYVASYVDCIGRNVAVANYGTNGGSSWTRSSTIPSPSDTVLVTSTVYSPAGNVSTVTDPAGIVNSRTYDNSDRLITTVENQSGTTPAVRTTHYTYTPDAWLSTLTSDNSTTGNQMTQWVRNVTTAQGSAINSKRLVYQKILPGGDTTTYRYNRQLQVTRMTDPNGTVHDYAYDKLGRLLSDTVSTFASGIDTTVGKLETGYNERGLVVRSTSKNAAGTSVVNEVKSAYNDFNQKTAEYQEHGGAVNTSTSLKVQYSYASGSANTVRPTGITYPNGTAITTAYGGTAADAISRPDAVKESTTTLASFAFLGLGTLVDQKYDAATNADWTMQNGGTGDAGDKYTGLDRFGRLVETIWKSGFAELVHSTYGRNRAGGVVWRRDVKAHVTVSTQDTFYTYDGLQQVATYSRGNLTPTGGPPFTGITSVLQTQNLTYDPTGNWTNLTTTGPALNQDRTHDTANQITTFTGLAADPTYDANGNMTLMPRPINWGAKWYCTWDAWNRLVRVNQTTTGGTIMFTAQYDALSRRTWKTESSTKTDFYYDKQWRSVEDRIGSAVEAQYTWSPLDRWTLILRKRSTTGTLNETLWCLKDYLDPVAVIDSSAAVLERYRYDAFGTCDMMTAAFVNRTSSSYDWNFLFHAEFQDESQLYNYGYRYYHTNLGRWISRDPIGELLDVNLYRFVKDNPSNVYDLLGLADQGVIPLGRGQCKDAAGAQCCFKKTKAITIYHIKPSLFGEHTVGHVFIDCPTFGIYGFYPKDGCLTCKFHGDGEVHNDADSAEFCQKQPQRCQKEEFVACPQSIKKIKDQMKKSQSDPGKYGLGPGGSPNCSEWANSVLRNAGFNPAGGWVPGI